MDGEQNYHTHAVIVSIGDEIAQGEALDTNTQWLARQLVARGIRVVAHVTCADELETLTRTFEEASTRAPLVISTGGLGPTADDLTREALSRASGSGSWRTRGRWRASRRGSSARGRDILDHEHGPGDAPGARDGACSTRTGRRRASGRGSAARTSTPCPARRAR